MHVSDRGAITDATDLIALYGAHAADEAASRAETSRSVGNVIHYCRWRQIERLVVLIATEDVIGTIH